MNQLQNSLQEILNKEIEIAEKNELLIGINPKSYLGAEILKQSREIMNLKFEIQEFKKMTAELISRLNEKS